MNILIFIWKLVFKLELVGDAVKGVHPSPNEPQFVCVCEDFVFVKQNVDLI